VTEQVGCVREAVKENSNKVKSRKMRERFDIQVGKYPIALMRARELFRHAKHPHHHYYRQSIACSLFFSIAKLNLLEHQSYHGTYCQLMSDVEALPQ
jgi:hypothetical protein